MSKRPAGMEPANDIASYDDVPWFRKQWFLWVLILVFIPAMIFIALSGDVFAKANKRMKEHDGAEVWRYTNNGKLLIVVSGIVLVVVGFLQVFVA